MAATSMALTINENWNGSRSVVSSMILPGATAVGQQAVFGSKDKGHQKEQGLGHDDNAAGCAIQIVAQPGAENWSGCQ